MICSKFPTRLASRPPCFACPLRVAKRVGGARQSRQASSNKNGFTLHHFLKNGAGFTFLELIIAILVITVGMLGALAVARQPIFYTSLSISRLTASYLAQEGIEIVRNLRDENWLAGRDWNNGLNSCTIGCQADFHSSSLEGLQNDGLLSFGGDGFYVHDASGTPTKFTRKITIIPVDVEAPIGEDDYLKVTVLVQWEEKGKPYDVEVQENLYNWYQQ